MYVILNKKIRIIRAWPNFYDFICQIVSELTEVYCTQKVKRPCYDEELFCFIGLHFALKMIYTFNSRSSFENFFLRFAKVYVC